jgi:hypothetical protein
MPTQMRSRAAVLVGSRAPQLRCLASQRTFRTQSKPPIGPRELLELFG